MVEILCGTVYVLLHLGDVAMYCGMLAACCFHCEEVKAPRMHCFGVYRRSWRWLSSIDFCREVLRDCDD